MAEPEAAERIQEDVTNLIEKDIEREAMASRSALPRNEGQGHWIIDHGAFKGPIAALVLMNTVTMGFEADFPQLGGVMMVLENVYTVVFLGEMIVKIVLLKFEYFTDKWNLLDGALVSMSIVDLWIFALLGVEVDLQALSILRILRLFRLIRVLRLIKQFRELAIVIQGVISAMQTTFWVASVLVIAIYVGAIFCRSTLDTKTVEGSYPGSHDNPADIDESEMMQNFNPHVQFGTVPRAMLTLFNVAILAEWGEVVWPIAVKQPGLVIFFVFFVIFVTFGIMNVIIGMIVDSVMQDAAALAREDSELAALRKKDVLSAITTLAHGMSHDEAGYVNTKEMENIFRWLKAQIDTEDFDDPAVAQFEAEHFGIKRLIGDLRLPRGCTFMEMERMLDTDGDGAVTCNEFVQCFYRLIDSDDFQQRCLMQMAINDCKFLVKRMRLEQQEARVANDDRLDRLEGLVLRLLPPDEPDDDGEAVKPFSSVLPSASLPIDLSALSAGISLSVLESVGIEAARRAVEEYRSLDVQGINVRLDGRGYACSGHDRLADRPPLLGAGEPSPAAEAQSIEAKQSVAPARWSDAEDLEVRESDPPRVANSGGQVIRAHFGADVEKLGLEVKWSPGPSPFVGVVEPHGAAWLQGLRPGDRIAACNEAESLGRDRSDVLSDLRSRPLELRAERPSF